MLGEVDLAHPTGADHPLDDVTSEDVTVVERHPESLQTSTARSRTPPLAVIVEMGKASNARS